SIGDAARIARQVADALAYAHSHAIVHRDVKPDNVLLDKSGHVLVTDFGIAKAAHAAHEAKPGTAQLTSEGMIIGTPQYMSPEQAAGDMLDGRSDIYSLGIVLYQMLAGTPPFDGPSSASILAQQLTQTPPPIRRERPDVPEEMAVVLYTVFSKAPEVAIRPPVPDSLTRALRARRALNPGDVALYAYQPAGQEDTTLLLLTRRRTVVITPHGVRSYARDSVHTNMGFDVRGGLTFRLVIRGTESRELADTVFRSLSFRDMILLSGQLNERDAMDRARKGRPRVRSRTRRSL